jgi:hypothetical protein
MQGGVQAQSGQALSGVQAQSGQALICLSGGFGYWPYLS